MQFEKHRHILVAFFLLVVSIQISSGSSIRSRPENEEVELFDPTSIIPDETEYTPELHTVVVQSHIRFRYCRTRIISTFINTDRNKSHAVNFQVVIPAEAFISKFQMKVDGKLYDSNATSNDDAFRIYNASKNEGRSITAGLVELSERKANTLNLSAVIGSKRTVTLLLTYEEHLLRTGGRYEHAINLTPLQSSVVKNFRITVNIEESQKITFVDVAKLHEEFSSGGYRDPEIENRTPKQVIIRWNNSFEGGDKIFSSKLKDSFLVQYELEDETTMGEVLVRNGYFVHFFAPRNLVPLRKHVVFALDISDSMNGLKLHQLQAAMIDIFDDLKQDDFFNILTFSSNVEVWSYFDGNRSSNLVPFPATEEYKESARHFIYNKLIPHGSTNIYAGLTKAIEICQHVSSTKSRRTIGNGLNWSVPAQVKSIIIFFTDGEPTSGVVHRPHILGHISSINKLPSVPIFSLAFGELADYSFLQRLSIQNSGIARKIYERSDADIQLIDFYKEISSPVLENLNFQYTATSPEYSISDVTNREYSLVFEGSEVTIAGRIDKTTPIDRNPSLKATVDGKGRFGTISYDVPVSICLYRSTICSQESKTDNLFMERLFAYLTIKKLVKKDMTDEFENKTCSDIKSNATFSVEAQRKSCELITAKEKAMELALHYGFVTPYTSLVMRTKSIVEEEVKSTTVHQKRGWKWFIGSPGIAPSKPIYEVREVSTHTASSRLVLDMNQSSNLETNDGFHRLSEIPKTASLTKSLQSLELITETRNLVSLAEVNRMMALALNLIASKNISTSHVHTKITRQHSSKILTIRNITWAHINFSLQYGSRNRSYKIASHPARHPTNSEPCLQSNKNIRGQCKHLKHCILEEFLQDYDLFLRTYFCPIDIGNDYFVGVCCK